MSKTLTLFMTKGLPGSGKTTYAEQLKTLAAAEGEEIRIVCKDDIRKELEAKGWQWSPKNERDVIAIRDAQIEKALGAGISVISADTNLAPKHEQQLRELAKRYGAIFTVVDYTGVPLNVCIERDAKRSEDKRVGPDVIKEMYKKYIGVTEMETYVPVAGTRSAIICDLDGTLALSKGIRGIFDYAKCAKDRVNKPVFDIIRLFHEQGTQIIYLSGREDWCRDQTDDFLKSNGCPPGPLFMRKSKDHRKDYIVKQELFNEHVRKQYNVRFVLDDRDQVVKMWRDLGLTCLQVAEGNF